MTPEQFARMLAGADVIAGRHTLPFDQLTAGEQERHRAAAGELLARAAVPSAPADRAAALRAETAEDLRSDLYDDLDSYQRQFRISGLQHAQIRDHLATYLTEGLLRRAANEAQVVADNPCPGFPDRCPNPVLVNPDPPAHFGGIRCGCGKQLPAVGAPQPKEA